MRETSDYAPNPYESPRTRSEATIPIAGADGSHSFRSNVIPLWVLANSVTLIGVPFGIALVAVCLRGLGALRDSQLIWITIGATLAALVLQTVVMYFMVLLFPVFVSDTGIRCFDFWGRYRFIAWTDVTGVKPINYFGLHYLRIYSKGLRRPIWLPQFMAKPTLFWPYLLSLLAADSSLAKAIREAGLA